VCVLSVRINTCYVKLPKIATYKEILTNG